MNLKNHQKEAIKKINKLKVAALFMKMGTGKTLTVCNLITTKNVIWFTPFSTKENLENELKKYKVKFNYKIIGYESIRNSDRIYLQTFNNINEDTTIIADESIFIKNEDTNTFKRLLKIRNKCKYAFILNGTPISKNLWDIYNQMFFLSPKILDMSRSQFQNTFFIHIKGKKNGKKIDFYKLFEQNLPYLKSLIEPYIFECELERDWCVEDVIINNEADKITANNYNNIKNDELNNLQLYQNNIILLLQKLLHISTLDKNKISKIVENTKNKKCIIFCNFLDEQKMINDKLDCYIINKSIKNRKEILKKWENDNKPIIYTYGTGSYGLNLQNCNEIHFSSRIFDYSKITQAQARIDRIGQKQDIKYFWYENNLKINQFIKNNIGVKKTISQILEQNLKKLTEEEFKLWLEKNI